MFFYVNIFFSTQDGIAEKLLLFKIKFCYFQPIDYLDMANLSTYFAYKSRIPNIYNKLCSITSKLSKTASSTGFIKKALHNNVIPKFAQIKGQFVNRHETFRQNENLCYLILTDMFVI